MRIIEYTCKHCEADKLLANVWKMVNIPCPVEYVYMEDVGEGYFISHGITRTPQVHFIEEGRTIVLSEDLSPGTIQNTVDELKGA